MWVREVLGDLWRQRALSPPFASQIAALLFSNLALVAFWTFTGASEATQPGQETEQIMPKQQFKKLNECDSEEWSELCDILRDWPTFGLFNIFMCHPRGTVWEAMVKILPLFLIVAQLLIPAALVSAKFSDYVVIRLRLVPGDG